MCKSLLQSTSVNILSDGGETLAMTAAQNGHMDLLDYLVRVERCDTTIKAHSGGNLLTRAVTHGSERMVRYILDSPLCAGLDKNAMQSGMTSIMIAATKG